MEDNKKWLDLNFKGYATHGDDNSISGAEMFLEKMRKERQKEIRYIGIVPKNLQVKKKK